jgi:hypothetical protein
MSPPVLLEPLLTVHGDALYQGSLLIATTERRAAQLLQRLAADLAADPPFAPPTEVDLFARLVALARAAEARQKPQRGSARVAAASAVYRSLQGQPLDQRLALGLHLLFGYEPARIAQALGTDPAAAGRLLEQALRAVAPATGSDLPDLVGSEHCYAVRAALIDPSSRERHSTAVRSHLATCAACRSFDQRWHAIGQVAEAALRTELRERRMPDDLRARLIAHGRPHAADRLRAYRFVIPLVAVLALVAALVLPGFTQRAVTVVDRSSDPVTTDPDTLLAQALALHGRPPTSGPAIWHGRFETLWYFDERTVAPLHAELWLDRANPARHRAQITHRDGGAPYELQLGSGADRLYYGLDAAYAPVLYGGLNTGAVPERPRLYTANATPDEQIQALATRLQAGPWSIPPFYLQQALDADDLRVLGRQRDGERTVQILSFAGISPLNPPSAEPERVTVLLALDSVDGRLRSATELIGPPGGTQVSRVTWRLINEEQFEGEQSTRRAFNIDNAWNGLGDFATIPPQPLADPALPFLSAVTLSDPATFVSGSVLTFWMPATAPPGVDRAVMIGGNAQLGNQRRPDAVVYLGAERRLSLRYGRTQPLIGETLTIAGWDVTIRPERGGYYNAFLEREPDRTAPLPDFGASQIFLESRGFSRSEIEQVIADLQPFGLDSLTNQDALFFRQEWGDRAVRRAILTFLRTYTAGDAEQATYLRWRGTNRINPNFQPPADPYTPRQYTAFAADYALEHWYLPAANNPTLLTRMSDPANDTTLVQQYAGNPRFWFHDALNDTTTITPAGPRALNMRLPAPLLIVADLLSEPGWASAIVATNADTTQITGRIATRESRRYAERNSDVAAPNSLVDLQPETIAVDIELTAPDELRAVRIYAEDLGAPALGARPERILIEAYELEERAQLPPSAAPAELRGGEPPSAGLIRDLSGLQSPHTVQVNNNLDDTLALAPFPIFALPADQAELQSVEQNLRVAGMNYRFPVPFGDHRDIFTDALDAGLAVRLTYDLPGGPGATPADAFQITQGPAAPLRAYLRSSTIVLWEAPEPMTLSVAGQAIEAWIGTLGNQSRLIFAYDTLLFIVDASTADMNAAALPLLADLQPALGAE